MKIILLVVAVCGLFVLSIAFQRLGVDENWMFALLALVGFVIFAAYRRSKHIGQRRDIVLIVPSLVAIGILLSRDLHLFRVGPALVWSCFAIFSVISLGYFYAGTTAR